VDRRRALRGVLALSATIVGGRGLAAFPAIVPPFTAQPGATPAPLTSGGPGQWTWRASLPVPRSEVGVAELDGKVYVVAELDGKVYVVGGYARGNVDQPLNQVDDPVADQWQTLASLPRGLNHVAVVGFNHRLYAFGGFTQQNQDPVADVAVYDPAADGWSPLAPLPSPLGAMAVAELGGGLHLVGGRDTASVTTHRIYDPTADQWSDAAPMRSARDHLALAPLGGRLFAAGGRLNTPASNLGVHEAYDPASDSWEPRAPLPTPRSGVATAALGGWMLVMGGERTGGVFATNEAYDPSAAAWTTLQPLPSGRHGTGAGVVGNVAYVPGGGPVNGGSLQLDENLAFGSATS